MRWLLLKDLRILRRSPLMTATLVLYPVVVALLVGFAISSPPAKPRVAIYSGVQSGKGKLAFGSQELSISKYAKVLYSSVQPVKAQSARTAINDVRRGTALAAIIIPGNIDAQIQSLIRDGTGHPAVTVVLNSRNPLESAEARNAIQTRAYEVEQAVARQVLNVAVDDLQRVLGGGRVNLLGYDARLLGLKQSRAIIVHALSELPADSPLRPGLKRVVSFADVAIAGLSFATPVLGEVAQPLTVRQVELTGRTTPAATYAAAIAALFLLMFVTLLMASGTLALERSENAYQRLVRGLVRPGGLLAEKVLLALGLAVSETFVLAAIVSLVAPLDWTRVELWLLVMVFSALAFAALGVAVGAVVREVSVASLLAFLIGLPVAFVALVPGTAVSSGLDAVLNVISFVFPFRAGLDALVVAFGGGGATSIPLALLHLALLAAAFGGLARLALARFAAR